MDEDDGNVVSQVLVCTIGTVTYLREEVDDLQYPRGTRDNSALNCQELLDNRNDMKDGENTFYHLSYRNIPIQFSS